MFRRLLSITLVYRLLTSPLVERALAWLVLFRVLPVWYSDPIALLMTARSPCWRLLRGSRLDAVLRYIATTGFDPRPLERAGARLAGVTWQGQILSASDRLYPLDAHYLRHVVVQSEWLAGTSVMDYHRSLRAVILDPRSGVYMSRYRGRWQVACILNIGTAWRMVEYRVQAGHWMTGFHPVHGLNHFDRSERTHGRWLRHPK
jgi:hypothetical protein